MYFRFFAVHLKLIQHCLSTVLQFFKKLSPALTLISPSTTSNPSNVPSQIYCPLSKKIYFISKCFLHLLF